MGFVGHIPVIKGSFFVSMSSFQREEFNESSFALQTCQKTKINIYQFYLTRFDI